MVKFSDIVVDKSLYGLGTDWLTSFGRQFDFHDVIYHIPSCNVDNRWPDVVLHLMDVQNVCKNTRFSLKKRYGKF